MGVGSLLWDPDTAYASPPAALGERTERSTSRQIESLDAGRSFRIPRMTEPDPSIGR